MTVKSVILIILCPIFLCSCNTYNETDSYFNGDVTINREKTHENEKVVTFSFYKKGNYKIILTSSVNENIQGSKTTDETIIIVPEGEPRKKLKKEVELSEITRITVIKDNQKETHDII